MRSPLGNEVVGKHCANGKHMLTDNISPARSKTSAVCLFLGALLFILWACNNDNTHSPFSKSAEDDLKTFSLAPGFHMELIASEPLIMDPVAMTIDEYGRMYVVEMAGMPLNRTGIGKVILLSDTSRDGRMDKRTVFADSLIMPSGIMRWKKGVIVTDPPFVYYMEDDNGDGVADTKDIMLSGFNTANLEGNVNNPLYGLDNWIYLASLPGNQGGTIRFGMDSSATGLKEGSVRFRPDTRELETLSARSQFGHTFDAWGNHFMLNNHEHIFHEVIAARYLNRNPDLLVPRAIQHLPDHTEVFPITENPEYQMLTEIGVFTAACGITAYLGGAFPEDFNTNITFVAEPASNVVHADRLGDSGVSFKAERVFERSEFLASTDPYSRIVNLSVGPDGALYALDFYRQIIEGPEFMSDDIVKTVNLYNGNDKGRIYRITADGSAPINWTDRLQLGDADAAQLVQLLDNKNNWWRLNAQRLLVDRFARNHDVNDSHAAVGTSTANAAYDKAESNTDYGKKADVVRLLTQMAQNRQAEMGRLHALWTLAGIDELTVDLVREALRDPAPGIRVNAIKLAERYLSGNQRLVEALLQMRDDPDLRVRFQLVCTLGSMSTAQADAVRSALLFQDVSDTWMQIAALSAGSSQSVSLLHGVLDKFDDSSSAYASLVQLLGGIIGKSQDAIVVKQFIRQGLSAPAQVNEPATLVSKNAGPSATAANEALWQAPLLEGLSRGLSSRKSPPPGLDEERELLMLAALESTTTEEKRKSALQLLRVLKLPKGPSVKRAMQKAEAIAVNGALKQDERANAIMFIALQDPSPYTKLLEALTGHDAPILVQLAAVRALGQIPGEEVTEHFLKRWPSLTPGIRVEVINTFLASDERIKMLLNKVESGEINRGAISWHQSVHLRSTGEHMQRARVLLTETADKRNEVIGAYRDALTIKGNREKGKTVYQANCAVCHQVAGSSGRKFGPDLGTLHAWPPEDIMTNILDPNKSIALGYDMWMITLNNGKPVQGIISSETPTSITVTNSDGEVTNIARQDIASLETTNMSAMPTDFEKKINKQQMADLLAFLKELK